MRERLKQKLESNRGKRYFIFWIFYWAATLGFLLVHYPAVMGEDKKEFVRARLMFAAVLAFFVFSVIFCTRRWLNKKRPERKEDKKRIRIWHFLALFANAAFAFLVIEYVNNEKLLEMKFAYVALNILGIYIISLIFLFWLNSFRRAMLAVCILFTVMSLIFYYVFLCRGEPLQLIDFFSFGTAVAVAGTYDFVVTRAIALMLPLSLCVIGLYLHFPDWMVARKKKGRIGIRLGVGAFMIFGFWFFQNVNWNGNLGILTNLWAPIKTYREYGTTVGFFCVAKYMRLTAPEGYSVAKTEEIAQEAEKQHQEEETSSASDPAKTQVKPVNIIAIMSESWADYRLVGDLETNEEVMPYYDSMTENTIKGHTLVCIRGGGTAKTEYEFLTGNSVKRHPGMVPYVSYFTHNQYSLVTTLESQGYQTAAMHPNKGSNWKRTTAYRLLDFDTFYTKDDFDESVERIRGHISDRANFEKIIEVIENKEDSSQPFFLFDVTMQNHGGYTNASYQGTIKGENYQDSAADQYLSLLKESDEALEYLIEYFKNCQEPTLIVMFGDHYPDLSEEFTEAISGKKYDDLTLDEKEMYFATPFFIWANYDIEEAENVLTSTNYLGTLMMEQTGLEMADYNYYLQDLMQEIPALNHLGYMDTEGQFHSWEEADQTTQEEEWEYECLQYNNLAEKRNRLNWFFTLNQ